MSFGGGGTGGGTIRYALVVDDAQATTKLNTFKTNLTGLATPTATLNKNLAQMGTQLKSTSTSVTQMGTSLKSTGAGISQTTTLVNQQAAAQQKLNTVTATTGKNVATMGNQFKASVTQIKSAGPPLANLERTSTGLGTKVKDMGTKFGGLAVGLSATTTSALQLAAGFRDYGDAQIAVDRANRKLSLGQEALVKAQDKLVALQKAGVTSGKDYAQAQLDVQQAQKQVEIQTQLVGEAQERMFDSQTQFVASVVPTVLGAFGTLSMAVKDFGLKGDAIRKIIPGLSAGFASLAGSIKGINFSALAGGLVTVGAPALAAVAAIWLLIGAIQSFNNINALFAKQMGLTTKDGIPLYKAAWLDLKKTLPAVFGELTAEERKMIDNYKKTPEELGITNAAIQEEVKKGFTELNIPPEFQEKFNKIIENITAKIPGIGKASAESADGVDTLSTSTDNLTDAQLRLLTVEEQLAYAREQDAEKNALQNKQMAEGIQLAGDASGEIGKLTDTLIGTTKTLGDTRTITGFLSDNMAGLTVRVEEDYQAQQKLNQAWRNAHKESLTLNDSLLAQADALNATNETLAKYTPEVGASEEEITALNDALRIHMPFQTELNNNLMLGKDRWKLYVDAQQKGVETAGEYLASLIKQRAQNEAWLGEMDRAIPGLTALAETYDLTNEQIIAFINNTNNGVDAVAELNKEWDAAVKTFEEKPLLMKEFKIEADPEEFIDDFVDRLSKKERKKVKMKLKIEQAAEDAKVAIDDILALYTNLASGKKVAWDIDMVTSPKSAKRFGNNLIKTIDEQFGGRKNVPGDWRNFQQQIEEAAKSSDPVGGILAAINDPKNQKLLEQNPIPVKIVADDSSLPTTVEEIQAFMNEHPVEFPAHPSIDIDPNTLGQDVKDALGITGHEQGMEIPATAAVEKIDWAGMKAAAGWNEMDTTAKITKIVYEPGTTAETPFIESKSAEEYAAEDKDKTPKLDFTVPLADIQTLQKALDSLAQYGIKNLIALGKAAKTHLNSVANYAAGATTFLQTNQQALDSLANYGAKNMQTLGKNAKTHFNSVANYANGATGSLQTLQKALDSLQKYGVKNMAALAKAAKTNFNTVANYADGATTAVQDLQSAIDKLKDKTVTVTYKQSGRPPSRRIAQQGMHETLRDDTLIMAHKGERVDIGYQGGGSGGRSGGGGGGNIVVNLTNILADKEITRTFRREMGKEMYRFGPT